MNGAVRPGIVNGSQQQNILGINQNFMQPPSIPSMSLLNQQGPPGQPRYPGMPQQVQQQQMQQQRQLPMGRPQQPPHLPFNPANIMNQAQNPVRRVPSQPHMNLGLPGQIPMRQGQSLQQAQQQHQQQQQQQRLQLQQELARQQQQGLVRTQSNSQVMNSLGGPLGPHQQMTPFQAAQAQQHMNPQISASPRQPPGLGMTGMPTGPLPLNRARMNPDDSFAFPGSQFSAGMGVGAGMPRQGMNNPAANGMYPFGSSGSMSNPASSPPPGMQISDLAQGGSPGSITGTPNRNSVGGFMSSSPQQFDVMSNGSNDPMFNPMPPPTGIPPRPPSHGGNSMSQQQQQMAQQAQAQQQHQQQQQQAQQQHHQQQQQAQQHHQQQLQHQMQLAQGRMQGPPLSMSMAIDPMNSIMNSAPLNGMGMGQMQPQRPQSQPQNVMSMNMNMGMGMPGPGRPPSQAGNSNANNAISGMAGNGPSGNGGGNIPRPASARGSPSQNQMQMASNSNNNSNNGANSNTNAGAIPNNNNTNNSNTNNNNNTNPSNPSNPASSLSPPGPSTSTVPTSTPSNHASTNNTNSASGSSSVIATNTPLTATGRLPNAPPGATMPSMPPNSAPGSGGVNFPYSHPLAPTHPLGSTGGPMGMNGINSSMMPIAPRPPSSARGGGAGGNSGPQANNLGGNGNSQGPGPGQGQAHGPGLGQGPGDQQRQSSQPPHGPGQPPQAGGPNGGPRAGGPPGMMLPNGAPMPGLSTTSNGGNMAQQPGNPGSYPHPHPHSHPLPAVPAGAVLSAPNPGIGHGQGLMRLLQFSGLLSQLDGRKLDYKWWQDVVQEYFHPASVLKFTLWRDSQRVEAKPFEIGVPILPRFFLVTTQSGVKSMSLTLDGARERFFGAGHSVIECVTAQWTYRYTNGYCVVLRGPLTVHVIITDAPRDPNAPPNPRGQPTQVLKFNDFQFDANAQEKFIAVDNIGGIRHNTPMYQREIHPWLPAEGHSPSLGPITAERQAELDHAEAQRWEEALVKVEEAEIPGEPVNAFGIPQATMRCLELAESVMSMAELITFSEEIHARSEDNPLSAMDTLSKYAAQLRDTGQVTLPPKDTKPYYLPFQHIHEIYESSVGQSLDPGASGFVVYPDGRKVLVKNPWEGYQLTHGGSISQNSPDKHGNNSEPPPPQTPSVAASPAISSGGTTNNTPALASATLKRKNPGSGESTSPVVGNQESSGASGSSKPRVPRKRNRTQPS
ncbi:hypothetical protein D9619_001156 [Psilocybe cf. subviscida]|uniref:Uncharacterized protein n=1 Tax=Psilocybe cf. subviscida TaxID=2480587 RepID=A0A8H5BD13_9AGAR|nr:hypothetical protein D9619_001156 [Psilocybe cf. subviscida]